MSIFSAKKKKISKKSLFWIVFQNENEKNPGKFRIFQKILKKNERKSLLRRKILKNRPRAKMTYFKENLVQNQSEIG